MPVSGGGGPPIIIPLEAGKGALVDGSVVASDSKEASMLFHSCTFITPGADALTMTNGSRVEWLNSFTYYANRSLYATDGDLGFASLGTKFGAEVRSIASASVYGDYGAVADGPNTLMYLIQYNFAYIGTGTDSSNDNTLVIEDNQVVELNNGKIYYQSVDQRGNFKVGDAFYVNQADGTTSIDISSGNITGISSLTLTSGNNVTFINAAKIQTGNFAIFDNNIETLAGDFNLTSANGEFYLTLNANVSKNVDLTGDLIVGGELTFGNQITDNVQFVADVNSNIIPNINKEYELGSTGQRWQDTFLTDAYINNVHIYNNIITSVNTDTNLQITANGSAIVIIPSNNVDITNNLTVTGLSTTKNISITGDTTHVGLYEQAGNIFRIGNTDITGNLTVSEVVQFQDIEFNTNNLRTTLSNNSLTFVADGDGIVNVKVSDVTIDNNLYVNTVDTTTYLNSATVTTTTTADIFDISDVYINDNYFTTLQTDQNLELRANGSGKIYVPLKNVEITNQLSVTTGHTYVKSVSINGDVSQTGDWNQTGDIDRTGNTDITGDLTVTEVVQFQDIEFNTNNLRTTLSNNDLIFVADGTGIVNVKVSDVTIDNDLTVNVPSTTTYFNTSLNVTTTTTSDIFDISDVYINDNYFTTLQTDQDLQVKANGTGRIYIPLKNLQFDEKLTVVNNVTVNGLTTLQDTEIVGTVTQTGNYNQTGDVDITGNVHTLNANITNPSYIEFPNFKLYDNKIDITATDTNLQIIATGNGSVVIEQWLSLKDTTVTNTRSAPASDAEKSIIFSPNGTGNTVINSTKFLTVPIGNDTNRVLGTPREFRQNSSTWLYEGYAPSGRVSFTNLYDDDRNTYLTPELTPGANDQTLRFGIDGVVRATITDESLTTNNLHIGNIQIVGNEINHLTTNDINILHTGTGVTNINNIYIKDNKFYNNTNDSLSIGNTNNGYTKFMGTGAVRFPAGPTLGPEGAEIGMIRYNTSLGYIRVFDGENWRSAIPAESTLSADEVMDIMDIWTIILG